MWENFKKWKIVLTSKLEKGKIKQHLPRPVPFVAAEPFFFLPIFEGQIETGDQTCQKCRCFVTSGECDHRRKRSFEREKERKAAAWLGAWSNFFLNFRTLALRNRRDNVSTSAAAAVKLSLKKEKSRLDWTELSLSLSDDSKAKGRAEGRKDLFNSYKVWGVCSGCCCFFTRVITTLIFPGAENNVIGKDCLISIADKGDGWKRPLCLCVYKLESIGFLCNLPTAKTAVVVANQISFSKNWCKNVKN